MDDEKLARSLFVLPMLSMLLKYKVEKFDRGYYYIIYFKAEGKSLLELERIYTITEDVMKFMTLKYAKQAEVKAFNGMVEKANAKLVKARSLRNA